MRFITFMLVATAAIVNAAAQSPSSQLPGSDDCNAARTAIVRALAQTNTNVGQIQDPATQQAAQAGVQQAASGIRTIAQALQAGQAPPAAARNVTAAGLVAVGNALSGGDLNDPAVVASQGTLNDAVQAGNDVVALC